MESKKPSSASGAKRPADKASIEQKSSICESEHNEAIRVSNYSHPAYWDARYANNTKPFEWLQKYSRVK